MIKFDKLWETAKSKGISTNALHNKYHISKSQLSRLRHNQGVNTCTLDRLCNILECNIADIMEHYPDNNFFSCFGSDCGTLLTAFFIEIIKRKKKACYDKI